jgi:hypothetical protein
LAGVQDAEGIAVRLRDARSLPELLAVSFDAFEVIRVLARGSEDLTPSVFAAFMTAADAAVDGREAITIAPSLPPGPGGTLFTSPLPQIPTPSLMRWPRLEHCSTSVSPMLLTALSYLVIAPRARKPLRLATGSVN